MTYQQRVRAWVVDCFGLTIADDRAERSFRFLEEALELAQSVGATREQAGRLVDYVYGRPVGEPAQEVGGVMVTLAALVSVVGLDLHAEAERELKRISAPDVREKIRRKQASKPVVVVGSPDAVLPQPSGASPQAETSDFRCSECGGAINAGEFQVFGVCDACWDKTHKSAPVSPVEPTPEPPTNPPCARCGHALSAHRPEFGACDGRDRPCACPEYQVPTVEPEPCIDCPLCGEEVRQVSSATLSLALSQHVTWACRKAPLKVEREQPDEQPAEIPAVPHKPVVNLMEALKKSLESLDRARKP